MTPPNQQSPNIKNKVSTLKMRTQCLIPASEPSVGMITKSKINITNHIKSNVKSQWSEYRERAITSASSDGQVNKCIFLRRYFVIKNFVVSHFILSKHYSHQK